jgi:hypothetical protein
MSHECDHDPDGYCDACRPSNTCPHSNSMLTQEQGADGWNRLRCECGTVVMATKAPFPRPRTYEEQMADKAQEDWEKWRGL